MPQFQKRRTQPMRPDSYRRIARLVRGMADRIDACAERRDSREKAVLTAQLHRLAKSSRDWWLRHRATVDETLTLPPDSEQAMREVIKDAQAILTNALTNDLTPDEAITKLLRLLDGPRTREATRGQERPRRGDDRGAADAIPAVGP